MDRSTANELCRRAGVAEVPSGADPQDWLDDNDVFDTGSGEDGARQAVVAEVYADRIATVASDKARLAGVLAQVTAGLVHTTAFPFSGPGVSWAPLDSGLWGAMSAAPNEISVYRSNGIGEIQAVRYAYGNAVVYYVRPQLLDLCLEAWWLDVLRTGYRHERGDVVAGVRWAAKHALEKADKYADCLGGDDAVRFVAKSGREKLNELAGI